MAIPGSPNSKGTQIAYAIIPVISEFAEPLRTQIRTAFANSLKLIWQVMTGLSAGGLLSCVLMKEVPMRVAMDESWTLKHKEDEEHGVMSSATLVDGRQ